MLEHTESYTVTLDGHVLHKLELLQFLQFQLQ